MAAIVCCLHDYMTEVCFSAYHIIVGRIRVHKKLHRQFEWIQDEKSEATKFLSVIFQVDLFLLSMRQINIQQIVFYYQTFVKKAPIYWNFCLLIKNWGDKPIHWFLDRLQRIWYFLIWLFVWSSGVVLYEACLTENTYTR